jgi:outer membrane protein
MGHNATIRLKGKKMRKALIDQVTGLKLGAVIGLSAALLSPIASAQSLQEALSAAYQTNPRIAAARERLRQIDEGVPQAKSAWRPQITGIGTFGATDSSVTNNKTDIETSGSSLPLTAALTISQTLFDSGRTESAIKSAEMRVELERVQLFSVESSIMLTAISAYLNVVRNESILTLRINNAQRLSKQLEASRDRFRVGEVTKTDVAQAESRLASANSQRAVAEANLVTSRLEFEHVVGILPEKLAQPAMLTGMPESQIEAVERGMPTNFPLIQARFQEQLALEGIRSAQAKLQPSVNLIGSANGSLNTGGGDNEAHSVTLEAQLSVPLYQRGSVFSEIRTAKTIANRARILVEEARRTATDRIASSYEAWSSSLTQISSLKTAVTAAEVALDGVNQEGTVGARTVLDTLDAEQELLTAQVNLVSAERNSLLNAFRLLNEMGELTAVGLQLPVEIYDYDLHYRSVRNKYWGE